MPREQSGTSLITKERQRQIDKLGYTGLHDDEHKNGELVFAALCYAYSAIQNDKVDQFIPDIDIMLASDPEYPAESWPWAAKWWKPKTPIKDLIRAGALIAAEIDYRLRKGETVEPG